MLPGREDPHKLRGSMKTCVGTFSWRPICRLFLGGRPGRLGTLATTIHIFERQAPPPTSQHITDAIRLDKEKAAFLKEIVHASPGHALYSQRGGYRGHGRGHGGSGRFGRQKTYRCTDCKIDNHTTEACGK